MSFPAPSKNRLAVEQKIVLAAAIISLAAAVMAVLQIVNIYDGAVGRSDPVVWTELLCALLIVGAVARAAPLALREMRERATVAADAAEARLQVEMLFQMTDMLQSALDYSDANAVLQATAERLLQGFVGALYIFNNSRDRLDLSTSWNWSAEEPPAGTVVPAQCWALKRGRAHLNQNAVGALRCPHQGPADVVLEIPMMARGEVHGLLNLRAEGLDAEVRLTRIIPLAGAVADAMSLAISNIALRERLRTQALRDPLTGLYNRRYMEDVLERFVGLAERNESPVTAIMIDLDHFKRLNDEHGHALGDAVLRGVAATIVGALRQCDVACRYGGEELVVLMPDCGLNDAIAKAEVFRSRIESLSEMHGARITASFGVATIPDTSAEVGDLLTMADAALYRAKQNGRNRVEAAPIRPRSMALAAE